jgi:hypothetical protein
VASVGQIQILIAVQAVGSRDGDDEVNRERSQGQQAKKPLGRA